MLWLNLLLATVMVSITVTVHFLGLNVLIALIRRWVTPVRRRRRLYAQGGLMLIVAHGLILLHTIEMWLYAIVYRVVGAEQHFKDALYFSIATFTTVGYGDKVLDAEWRIFGSTEAGVGLLMFGWSTAVLISVTSHLPAFEEDWEDEEAERADENS